MWIADDFRDQLAAYDLDVFDSTSNTIYAVRPDLTLAYHNQAWTTFARANGAHELLQCSPNADVVEACAPVLRHFYRGLFTSVLEQREEREHPYMCPSSRLERKFVMRLRPLPEGVLVTHHLLVERPHTREGAVATDETYTNGDGFIVQCAHCRVVRRIDDPETWDWVPDLIEAPPDNISHGLCPTCFQQHYPDLARRYYARNRED